MSKTILGSALVASVVLSLPLLASADSGHGNKADSGSGGGHHEANEGHAGGAPSTASLAVGWAALMAARDAIAGDVESGALDKVHEKAEPLPELVANLVEQSEELDAGKRARVEGAAKQVARVANALHVAADRGDADRTRKELTRLDGLLELIRAQYPADDLDAGTPAHDGHSAAPGPASSR
jgi:hypothetical protein